MTAQVFLIAPADAEPATFAARLQAMLAAHETPVLLVPRNGRTDAAYKALLRAVLPIAQPAGCAVLLDDDIDLAKALGADGVQVTGSSGAVKAAIAALKPDMIVGAGPIRTRDDAMTAGELGADYVFFGPLAGPLDDDIRNMAFWWAEAMQVPSVLSDPDATPETLAPGDCEFVALSENLWGSPLGPDAALAAFIGALEKI
jgi:thiamine-phosphate pyrophosphorylase